MRTSFSAGVRGSEAQPHSFYRIDPKGTFPDAKMNGSQPSVNSMFKSILDNFLWNGSE